MQVLNFIFDPCSKVKWGNPIKKPHISFIIASRASKCESKPYETIASEFFKYQISFLNHAPRSSGALLLKSLTSPLSLLLELQNVKANHMKSWQVNFFNYQISPLTSASRSSGVIALKRPYIPLYIGSRASTC